MISSITGQMTDYEKARAFEELQATELELEAVAQGISQGYARKAELEKKYRTIIRTGRYELTTCLVETCDLCGLPHQGSGC